MTPLAVPPGTLYVVATPIGNPDDITLRALRVLAEVDLIAAEDTRKTGQLLAHHGIEGRLAAYHEHNEDRKTPELIDRIQAGASVAVVSDAGTPSVSDPGFRLVRAALAAGLPVVPVPGVSAAVAALSVSGLPTDAFVFVGFAPRKSTARRRLLERLAPLSETLIFYESPRRITGLLADLAECLRGSPGGFGPRNDQDLRRIFTRAADHPSQPPGKSARGARRSHPAGGRGRRTGKRWISICCSAPSKRRSEMGTAPFPRPSRTRRGDLICRAARCINSPCGSKNNRIATDPIDGSGFVSVVSGEW